MTAALTPDIIDKPALWRLYLEVTDDALEVMTYSTYHQQSLIHRRLAFDPVASSQEQALSTLVYDNELLLADFSRVGLLIHTSRYMAVPSALAEDTVQAIAASFWGDDTALVTDPLPVPGLTLISAPDRAVVSFLRRTYPTVTPRHPMAQLITYLYNRDRMSLSPRMYVHLRDGHIDIILFDGQRLMTASSFAVTGEDDMLYYILLVAGNTGFDLQHDDIMVCGSGSLRDRLQALLRQYATYVMPVVFPAEMYHAGKDALETPFELTVMPLCE